MSRFYKGYVFLYMLSVRLLELFVRFKLGMNFISLLYTIKGSKYKTITRKIVRTFKTQ